MEKEKISDFKCDLRLLDPTVQAYEAKAYS